MTEKRPICLSELQSICSQLSLNQSAINHILGLGKDLEVNDYEQFQEKVWFATLVYIGLIDTNSPYGPADPQAAVLDRASVTITDILKVTSVCVMDLLNCLESIVLHRDVSEAVTQQLQKVKRKYSLSSTLYHKFERMFGDIFKTDDISGKTLSLASDSISYKKKLCWVLFIHSKALLPAHSQDWLTSFHLLLACMEAVIKMTPNYQLKEPFDLCPYEVTGQADEKKMLKELCTYFHTTFEEAQIVQSVYLEPILQSFPQSHGCFTFESVEELYHTQYKKEGDFDELEFLNDPPQVLTEILYTRNSGESLSPTAIPQTPVRTALNTVQQLKSLLDNASNEPSAILFSYFQNCSVDPTISIEEGLKQMELRFVSAFTQVLGQQQEEIALNRFKMAVRLYYRIMEALLKIEKDRLDVMDFSNLLNKNNFHVCLLACAVEVVMTTYGISKTRSFQGDFYEDEENDFSFPWILEIYSIQAYDFYKVLESFVRAEPKLTRDIVKHLQDVENKILEELAWEQGSPLFDALLISEAVPQFTSHSPNTFPPPASPRPKRSQSLNLFFNKVCRLGHKRLENLCDSLLIPKEHHQKIWTCFEYCINHKPETLMKNRHLDQIMMCSVYGMCKVLDINLLFKMIVTGYRSMPHAVSRVYKEVQMNGQDNDSIINFYNTVFMHEMRVFILQFCSNNNTPPLSPVPKTVPSPLTKSPVYKMPGRQNFYVSPLERSPFKRPASPSQLTPRSRQLYCFGEGLGASEKLRNINNKLQAWKSTYSPFSASMLNRRSQENENGNDLVNFSSPGSMVSPKRAKFVSPRSRKSLRFEDTVNGSSETTSVK